MKLFHKKVPGDAQNNQTVTLINHYHLISGSFLFLHRNKGHNWLSAELLLSISLDVYLKKLHKRVMISIPTDYTCMSQICGLLCCFKGSSIWSAPTSPTMLNIQHYNNQRWPPTSPSMLNIQTISATNVHA